MKFTVVTDGASSLRDMLADRLVRRIVDRGNELVPENDGACFALNLTNSRSPRAFRRKSRQVFVFSLIEDDGGEGLKGRCYTALIQSLSNLLLCAVRVPGQVDPEVYFVTPEAGFYHIPFDPDAVFERLLPIASACFATDNEFSEDLPERFFAGSEVTAAIARYGAEMESLGVLPTPFPLREVLTPVALRQLYKIFGITGASYGNLSARESIPELGACTFWMTGRGVDKAHLRVIGKDILLVKGFDDGRGTALIAQPPGADRASRVSVDAVEHHRIYESFPGVGAIVHMHAWIDGVMCTRQNYPCGTKELAEEVLGLLRQTPDPCRAAVGLKNHGLTITGTDLGEIFDRVRSDLRTEVRMFA
jgi:ribulose-5-phosphate 4-epimerase/fuculose-1-phosphate aldolase